MHLSSLGGLLVVPRDPNPPPLPLPPHATPACLPRRDAGEAGSGLQLQLLVLDLSELASVRRAAEQVLAAEAAGEAAAGVQLLILNAGVMACPLMWVGLGCRRWGGVPGVG